MLKQCIILLAVVLNAVLYPAFASTCNLPEDVATYVELAVRNGSASVKGSKVISHDTMVRGDLNLEDFAIISGNVFASGNVTIGKNASITGNVYSYKDIVGDSANIMGSSCAFIRKDANAPTNKNTCAGYEPYARLSSNGLNLCHNPPWPEGDDWKTYNGNDFGADGPYNSNVLILTQMRGAPTPYEVTGEMFYYGGSLLELHTGSQFGKGIYTNFAVTLFNTPGPDYVWPWQESCECAQPPLTSYPNIVSEYCPREGGTSLLVPIKVSVGAQTADTFHGEIQLQTSAVGTWTIGDGKGELTASPSSTSARYRFSEADNGEVGLRFMPDAGTNEAITITSEGVDIWDSSPRSVSVLSACDDSSGIDLGGAVDSLTCDVQRYPLKILSGGAVATDFTGVVKLTMSDGNGDWSVLRGNGTLSNISPGSADYRFAASDNGSIDLGLYHEQGGVATMTAVAASIDSTATKQIHFRPQTLKIEPIRGIVGPAGCGWVPVNTANSTCVGTSNKQLVQRMFAVGKVEGSQSCDVIREYTGTKMLDFWSSYLEPSNPAGRDLEVERVAVGKSAATSVTVPVEFKEGWADFYVNYPDAGKLQIHARDDIGIGVPDDSGQNELIGSTTLYFNPWALEAYDAIGFSRDVDGGVMQVQNPTEARDREGARFIRASWVDDYDNIKVDTFNFKIRAVMDCDNDVMGHCSDRVTYSFAPPGMTALFAKQFPPLGGQPSSFIWKNDQTGVVGDHYVTNPGWGYEYKDVTFPQVGSLGLKGHSRDYLIPDNHVTQAGYHEVGRFIPDYLKLDHFEITPGCNNDFTYLGQQEIEISYELRAVGQGLRDYPLNFYSFQPGYPVAGKGVVEDDVYEDKLMSSDGVDFKSRLMGNERELYDPENWVQGVYSAKNIMVGISKLAQPDGPFLENGNAIGYHMKLTGFDGEKLRFEAEQDCPDDGFCYAGDLGDIVYGRIEAVGSHGMENSEQTAIMKTQFLSDTGFVDFLRDTCTAVSLDATTTEPAKSNSNTVPVGGSTTQMSMGEETFVEGQAYLNFSAPNRPGSLMYFVNFRDTSPWLLDENNEVTCAGTSDASIRDCVFATVEFGTFRGNDRIIWRILME